ncbi:hypothetical protein KKH43_01635 [Patescibacteria group bacterium]|nr:hypothetical protein [Patescibacteria group bacterium]
MMKKFFILSFVFVFILGVSGCVFNKTEQDQSVSKEPIEEEPIEEYSFQTNDEVMALGKSIVCSIDHEGEEGSQEGTLYVHDKKTRTDFTVVLESGREFKGHSIDDGEYVYSWNDESDGLDDEPIKYKSDISDTEDMLSEEDKKEIEENSRFERKCKTWRDVDESKFVPPSDLEFKDMDEELRKLDEAASGVEGFNDPCSVCETASGSSKEEQECKRLLKCD